MADRFSKESLTDTLWKLIDLNANRWGLDISKGTSQIHPYDTNKEHKLATLIEIEQLMEVLELVKNWQDESVHIAVMHKRMTEQNEGNN